MPSRRDSVGGKNTRNRRGADPGMAAPSRPAPAAPESTISAPQPPRGPQMSAAAPRLIRSLMTDSGFDLECRKCAQSTFSLSTLLLSNFEKNINSLSSPSQFSEGVLPAPSHWSRRGFEQRVGGRGDGKRGRTRFSLGFLALSPDIWLTWGPAETPELRLPCCPSRSREPSSPGCFLRLVSLAPVGVGSGTLVRGLPQGGPRCRSLL